MDRRSILSRLWGGIVRIGILGTVRVATALGTAFDQGGHEVVR
jgi:hypothetical protein